MFIKTSCKIIDNPSCSLELLCDVYREWLKKYGEQEAYTINVRKLYEKLIACHLVKVTIDKMTHKYYVNVEIIEERTWQNF